MQTKMDKEQLDTHIWCGMLQDDIWKYNIITNKHIAFSILQIKSQISFQN